MLPSRTKGFVDALVAECPFDSPISGPKNCKSTDIVIVCGVRTPICKAGKGAFSSLKCDQLLAPVLAEILKRVPSVPSDSIGDVIVGNCLQPGGGQAMARMAAFEAGYPYSVPVASINRQCASGLQAIASAIDAIKSGSNEHGLAVAAGVESMSSCSFEDATPVVDWSSVKASTGAAACMVPMGVTSEYVAKRYAISRADMDAYALESHRRATAAQSANLFATEIVSINGVSADGGVRADCSLAGLQKLPAVFVKKGTPGTTTAGNSSQTSDGAAAVLLATEALRQKLDLPVLCIWRQYVVVGVPPEIMGIGPAYAIPALLNKAGLTAADIDVFEINEAFASQVLFCIRFLSLDPARVNPSGGAIALGHPLGSSGTRLVVTTGHYLRRTGLRYAVVSLCVGTGMGAAALIENPDYRDSASSRKLQVSKL